MCGLIRFLFWIAVLAALAVGAVYVLTPRRAHGAPAPLERRERKQHDYAAEVVGTEMVLEWYDADNIYYMRFSYEGGTVSWHRNSVLGEEYGWPGEWKVDRHGTMRIREWGSASLKEAGATASVNLEMRREGPGRWKCAGCDIVLRPKQYGD